LGGGKTLGLIALVHGQFAHDGSAMWVQMIDGHLNVKSDLTSVAVRSKSHGRILAMSTTDAGVLAETDDQVLIYLGQSGWIPLVDEAVHSMRGYQNSKRYQHVITVVTRD
jgi:hypothetical protein